MSAPSSIVPETAEIRHSGSAPGRVPLRIVVGGAAGRMGRLARAAIAPCPDLDVVGTLNRTDDPLAQFRADRADIYLDLTVAAAARHLAVLAAEQGLAPVVGTSGLNDDDIARLREACSGSGVGGLLIPNFSLGAVLQMMAASLAAAHLACSGIAEAHHLEKRDRPSGTARATATRIAEAAGGELPPITSERRADVLATQTVTFRGDHERLVIQHSVDDRLAYVPGLLLALRRVRSCHGLQRGLESLLG